MRQFLLFLTLPCVVWSFVCPSNNTVGKCYCDRHYEADYEVHCPHIESWFDFKIDVNLRAAMQCKNDVSYQTILNYLDGLSIGPVTHLVIKNCPVPEETFKEFIQQKLGIPLSRSGMTVD